MLKWLIIFIILVNTVDINAKSMSKKQFIAQAFKIPTKDNQPKVQTIWLDDRLQSKIKKILDHRYPKLRLRYWINGVDTVNKKINQSVWFLDEIGKELPISFAVSIINNQVSLIKVLAFRESRGGEIRMQSFSEQFKNIGLNDDSYLNKTIDGISGATMSVTAMKKISRLALLLHSEINQ